jgi:hypothetical protein
VFKIAKGDVFGLIHPSIDVHTLGILSFSQILEQCGIPAHIADEAPCMDVESLSRSEGGANLRSWLVNRRISLLGFSYRLSPDDAVRLFGVLMEFIKREKLLAEDGGRIRAVFFAGLPSACDGALDRYPRLTGVFKGDETPQETMEILGIPEDMMPSGVSLGARYDAARRKFGEELILRGDYRALKPIDRSGYPKYGLWGDKVVDRIAHGKANRLPPLMRVHAGPYAPDRKEAVAQFLDWTKRLARGGYLDILSIGSSQLSQSNFGESWEGKIDGGGVPIATREEYAEVWRAARPMLVRTYAGTKKVPTLARMYEETIDIAWHALSFWWFNKMDGRGPNGVLENLVEHFEAMAYIASTGKPLEANVPHHFAFRGCDDLGYVTSGYLAAKAAKVSGIKSFILQIMLNTPKYTWGVQDLAKARVLLRLVRSLEGPDFHVYLQPRGGLDYFSPDPEKAKAQLAAVTAMMDDIEPGDSSSPQIIHVVSYSEALALADPEIMEESIKITRHALAEYRRRKAQGLMEDMERNSDLAEREESLYQDARTMVAALEKLIPNAYSPQGFYSMLKSGAFPLPWLTSCKDEFLKANIPTRIIDGGMKAVDREGKPLSLASRIDTIMRRDPY